MGVEIENLIERSEDIVKETSKIIEKKAKRRETEEITDQGGRCTAGQPLWGSQK